MHRHKKKLGQHFIHDKNLINKIVRYIAPMSSDEIIELGSILSGKRQGRTSKDQISVVDLTGVAVQDLQIAKAIYEKYLKEKK